MTAYNITPEKSSPERPEPGTILRLTSSPDPKVIVQVTRNPKSTPDWKFTALNLRTGVELEYVTDLDWEVL